jgi:hypothetical protein
MSKQIPLQQAVEMTTRYRQEKENILDAPNRNKGILPLSETFDRSDFDIILAQKGCVALRIYYGMDDSLTLTAIIVGVNDKNEDILPADQENGITEEGVKCPPYCPPGSPLNGG